MRPDPGLPASNVSRRILFSFVLSALIPVITIYLVSYNQISSQLDNEIRRQLYETSRSLGLSVYDRLLSAELNMKIIADGVANGSRPDDRLQNELLGTTFSGLSVYDDNGLVETLFGRDTSYQEPGPDQLRHLAAGNTALVIATSAGQEPGITLLQSLDDRAYGHPAILSANIRSDYLWNFPVYSPEFVCVLDPEDIPLFCSMLIDESDIRGLTDRMNASASNDLVTWDFDGARYNAQSWDIFLRARFLTPDLSLVIAAPSASIFMSFDDFKETFPKILILTGLLVALLSISQIRKTLGPLQKLTEATRRIAKGDYTQTLKVESGDEFSVLADSFNDMARHIEQQIRTISTMAEMDRLILSSLDTEYVLETLVHYLRDITNTDTICMITFDRANSGTARLYPGKDQHMDKMRTYEFTLEADELVEIESAESYLRTDDPASKSYLREAASTATRHYIVFPVHIRNQLSALICLGSRTRMDPDERTLKWILELSDRVAVALSSALREEKLFNQSHYDALTALPNRLLFRDRLSLVLERSAKTGKCVAVLLVDLDYFKQVNDLWGHEIGDRLLKQLAGEIQQLAPAQGSAGRSGGDEFMIFMPDMPDIDSAISGAERLSEKLIHNLSSLHTVDSREISITCSIGAAVFPRDAINYEGLLKCAEVAMYEAKSCGRNTFRFFNREHDRLTQKRIQLQNEFRLALDRNELCLYYQPKIACSTGRVTGVEALLRWQHPLKGLVFPGDLMPALMHSDLTIPVNNWVIEQACHQHRTLMDTGVRDLMLAINVPGEQFNREGMAQLIADVLDRTRLPANLLTLEITESTAIENIERAIGTMTALKQLGVGITIDDFGTGYSSLSCLQQIPADSLKIDRTFISRLATDSNSSRIVSTIITLAHSMGMTVIAEGVETQSQCDELLKLGCDELQGYIITQPLSAANFRLFMLRETAFDPVSPADLSST